MIRTHKYENVNVYQASLTPNDLANLRRTLAKRANQRIVRLERATSEITGESYAHIGALPLAKAYLSKTGRRRFTESIKTEMSYEEQRREIVRLQEFLKSKSSTVQGIREIERKRLETFESGKWGSSKWTGNARREIKFATTKEFYDFFHSSTFKELISNGFTSEQVVEAFDTAIETYDGIFEEALDALANALTRFKQKGSISLKELREAASVKALEPEG